MTKEEIIKILEGYMGGKIEPESTELYHAIEFIVDILESQPSLPSNLDDAAGDYGIEVVPDRFVPDKGDGYKAAYTLSDINAAFKAGAEWMAGQGETIEGYIAGVNDVAAILAIPRKEHNKGDKIVVQIRKK